MFYLKTNLCRNINQLSTFFLIRIMSVKFNSRLFIYSLIDALKLPFAEEKSSFLRVLKNCVANHQRFTLT
jgi:hypothetical protein